MLLLTNLVRLSQPRPRMFPSIYNRSIGSFFSSTPSTSPIMSAEKTLVEEAIAGHKIVIFSKSYCPYCKRAKEIFNSDFPHLKDQIYIKECASLPFAICSEADPTRRLDLSPDGSKIQDYLRQKTNQSTVPNIFINQEHVGGNPHGISIRYHPLMIVSR
jgi:glutaredoxin 3